MAEIAPKNGRMRHDSFIFIMFALGTFLGIWLGLALTMPKSDFPLGFSLVQVGEHEVSP
jgi:hypothetical protein